MTEEIIILAALIAFQIADYLTTRRIIALGGYERNPLVKMLMRRFGEHGGLLMAKAIVSALALVGALLLGPCAKWALLALCAVYALVLINNGRVIKRLRGQPLPPR